MNNNQEKPKEYISDKYLIIEMIAEGSYGVVYKGKNRKTGDFVAIKRFKNPSKQGIPTSGVREIDVIQHLESPYVLKPLDIYSTVQDLHLVMEWKGLTLSKLLKSEEPVNPKQILLDLLRAVLDLHDHNYFHRDLKPANILVDRGEGNIGLKLIDFGMAKQKKWKCNPRYTNEVGTRNYRAPELFLGSKEYDESIDVWAIGCIFYQLMTKSVMFKAESDTETLIEIFHNVGTEEDIEELIGYPKFGIKELEAKNWSVFDEDLKECQASEEEVDLLKRMIRIKPQERISCLEALEHAYFNN